MSLGEHGKERKKKKQTRDKTQGIRLIQLAKENGFMLKEKKIKEFRRAY